MSGPVRVARRGAAAALAAMLSAAADGSAAAQCNYIPLDSTVPQNVPGPANYAFTQGVHYWSAVAIRSPAGTDWDLTLYRTQAIWPYCIFDSLATSTQRGGVDVLVSDFNHSPFGTYYPSATLFTGLGTGKIELDAGVDQLLVNGATIDRAIGSADVVEIWDVHLEAGRTYLLDASVAGSVTPAWLLFRNPTTSPYSAGRDARVHDFADGPYVAPATDDYALVFLNENGGTGSVSLQLGTCLPPSTLASSAVTASADAVQFFRIPQTWPSWSAVGVRALNPEANFSIEGYGAAAGASWPYCFGGDALAASDIGAGVVDFVVGDFHHGAPVDFFARAWLDGTTPSSSVTEWDGGSEEIVVNDPLLVRDTGPGDVLEIWDVTLEAGQPYTFALEHSPGLDVRLFVFANPGDGPYWTGRLGHVLETRANASFTPDESGTYGVLVVNDDGQAGEYRVGVYRSGVAAPSPHVPATTAYRGASPNPVARDTRFAFDLAHGGRVRFDVLDAGGRVVSRIAERPYEAGSGSAAWQRGSLGAGVYFVRMHVNGREAGGGKVVVVD